MNGEQLIIGMPAGSLADPNRGGNLVELLAHAGFPTKGYDKGGPTRFPLTSFIVGWDGRPQEFGAQLAIGELDIAISGGDWMRERELELMYEYGQEHTFSKILSLHRGDVRIVAIRRPEEGHPDADSWMGRLFEAKPLITVVSEMPYLALEWIHTKAVELGFGESHKPYAVQKYKTPPRIDRGIVIYETWGKTEAKIANGAVDFGFEITQTGSAIRNYGLEIFDELLTSETAIYASTRLRRHPEKRELAEMVLLNLFGSVFAENKVLLFFNAKKEDEGGLVDYLRDNHLFGDEPTINEGVHFTEFSIKLDTDSRELPLARVRYELAKRGATHIETIPLDSSIPGLDVIQL